jgi:AraC family transcriptional regulator, transcriptional activator of pobA
LAHSNKSIKEISFELGFDEPTNFTKYFLKHAKTTPVRFREKFNLS